MNRFIDILILSFCILCGFICLTWGVGQLMFVFPKFNEWSDIGALTCSALWICCAYMTHLDSVWKREQHTFALGKAFLNGHFSK
jgi:hypothetical protein